MNANEAGAVYDQVRRLLSNRITGTLCMVSIVQTTNCMVEDNSKEVDDDKTNEDALHGGLGTCFHVLTN